MVYSEICTTIILKFVQLFGLDRIILLGYTRNLLPGKTQVMLACSADKKAASGTFLEFKILTVYIIVVCGQSWITLTWTKSI